MTADDLGPGIRSLVDLALRIDPHVVLVSTNATDRTTLLVFELEGSTPGEQRSLADALRSFRHAHRLDTEFIVVNRTSRPISTNVDLPVGWPPAA